MMRILSVLLVIAGLLAAGFGGAALLENYDSAPAALNAPSAATASEETVAAASAPEEDIGFEIASADTASPPEESASNPAPEAVTNAPPETAEAGEPALSDDEIGFMFQTQMEEGPVQMMRSAPLEGAVEDPVASSAAMPPAPKPSFEQKLQTVPVAHETPASAEYKRPYNVTFAIDATGDTTAADALPGRGIVSEGEATVSDRVEVRLSGASFAIEQTSPPIQTLSPLTENTWRWSVTALTAGDHDLTFEIFAIDSDAVTPLRTYRDTVTVKVSGLNRAIAFADQANPLFVLLGGIGSILAGAIGVARFFAKR
ncbi:MAG TPA: hypothetical protein PKY73_16500 [Hyphomonas sp.]|nr:hypothetical protein [Hyphomonas sp.]